MILLLIQFFVRLENIRKCFTQKGGIFVLEEFSEYKHEPVREASCFSAPYLCPADPKTRQVIQRRYKSQLSDQICYAVLCVFSYIAAGIEQKKRQAVPPAVAAAAATAATATATTSSPHTLTRQNQLHAPSAHMTSVPKEFGPSPKASPLHHATSSHTPASAHQPTASSNPFQYMP